MKKYRYPIILSLVIFLAGISYSFYFQIEPMVDDLAYDKIALNILNGRGYTEFPDRSLGMDRDILHIGQAYTAFLALIYKIFGHHHPVVWVIQALLHSLTCLMLFFICLNIFKKDIAEKVGLLAMGLYGFWPDLIESTAMLMTEIFFLFLAVSIIYLAIKFFQNPDFYKAVFLGTLVSIAVLTRPTIILFGLIFIAVILFKKDIKRRYVYLIPLILIPIIIVGSWMFRNYVKYDRFVITTAGGYDLWIGNNLQANGEMEPSQEIRDYFAKYGFVNIDKKGISEVKKFAIENPAHFLKLQAIKTSKYFSLIRPSGWWPYLNKIETALTLLFSGLFGAIGFIFGISGIWRILKEKEFFSRLLVGLTVLGPVAVIPIVVGTRYRYQIYPFLAIFAAYFLISWLIKKQRNLYRIPLIIFVIFFLNSIYDLIASFDVFLEHLHRII